MQRKTTYSSSEPIKVNEILGDSFDLSFVFTNRKHTSHSVFFSRVVAVIYIWSKCNVVGCFLFHCIVSTKSCQRLINTSESDEHASAFNMIESSLFLMLTFRWTREIYHSTRSHYGGSNIITLTNSRFVLTVWSCNLSLFKWEPTKTDSNVQLI